MTHTTSYGARLSYRTNAKDYDLNRNFPDYFVKNTREIQVETTAVMQWMKQIPFVLSGSLHGGALVAAYPYENNENRGSHYVFLFSAAKFAQRVSFLCR